MKKTIGLTAVLVAIFALFLVDLDLASAQDTPAPTNGVNGDVRIIGFKNSGDNLIGGFVGVNSGAGFSVQPDGNCLQGAEGIAAAKGKLASNILVKDGSLSLNSKAQTITGAATEQGKGGEVHTDGLVERANWGSMGNDPSSNGPSSIAAWDSSKAEYYGAASGPSPTIIGQGKTEGNIDLSITPNSTNGKVVDNSLAVLRGTPGGTVDPTVQGSAGLASRTFVVGPDSTAAASTDARAVYSATDPKKVSGGLEINSNTLITQKPNGSITLKATTDASTFTKNGACKGGCR